MESQSAHTVGLGSGNNRPDFDLASAAAPTFSLSPDGAMYDDRRRDYAAMTTMIFGTPPSFDAVIESVGTLEARLNSAETPS